MPAAVYILCFVTSLACAVLLTRSYLQTRLRLLLWAALCFAGLTVNNVLLVCDLLLFPDIDFQGLRHLSAAAALGVLLYGFIWETD